MLCDDCRVVCPAINIRLVFAFFHEIPFTHLSFSLAGGPGDPNLLTVAAFKLLTKKDSNTLVIVDRLVSPEILDLIPNEMKIARKLPGCADLAQEEIYWWAYQALNKGKHVIRLKIGDPFVFGRGGEEVLTFRSFGVEATVVPVSMRSILCFSAEFLNISHC